MNKQIQILSYIFLGISSFAFSQIQEEKLILERKRQPEVKAIEKKKTSVETIKNYPPEEKSETPVDYKITNVPAVSDFKTSTIQGEDISPVIENKYQNNYFRAGYGNYSRFLADGNITGTLDNDLEIGTNIHYLSTQGLKKVYPWDSRSANASLSAFINSYGDKGKLNIGAEYQLNDYHYYGIYALEVPSSTDLRQKTNQININAYYDFYSNEILNNIRLKTSFLGDRFDARENKVMLETNLSKHNVELPWSGITMNADLGLKIEAQNTDFQILEANKSNFFGTDISPKVTFFKGQSYLSLGSGISLLNYKTSANSTSEIKHSGVYWYPRAEALFSASEEFKFYAGVDGGLKLNSYTDMLQENPYLIPNQEVKPTETKYHFYFGLKGDIAENLKYDISAGFAKMKNIAFFQALPVFDLVTQRPYNYSNVFSTTYDDGNLSIIKGSVQYFPLQNLVLDAELIFKKYDLENHEYIYNIPLLNASIGGKYTFLNKKMMLGFKTFFLTDRTTNSYTIEQYKDTFGNLIGYQSVENKNDKIGGYADINLSAEYKIHKNFSIFALGNNLLSTKYQTYKEYRVLGAQILGGVKISF